MPRPSHDPQAIFRAWRYGQTRPVHVYRLLGEGTVEEQIYKRQISKAAVVSGVCDDEQIATAYSQANPNPNPNPNHLPLALALALASPNPNPSFSSYSQDELNELWTLRDALPLHGADLLAEPEARVPSVRCLGADKMLKRVLSSDDAGAWVSDVVSHDSLLEVRN